MKNSWRQNITPLQWRVLLAAHLGWLLDGFDVMLYAFALVSIKEEFHLSSAAAGALASVTLVASAVGGIASGLLADRFGRARVLVYSILTYSVFTGATALSTSVAQLVLWRALVGLGLGAEWSAGSVLVSETWPAEHRGKASGLTQAGWALGYILAALLSAAVIPILGWRALFLLGILPAFATLWIRRKVPEPELWKNSRHLHRRSAFQTLSTLFRPGVRARVFWATLLTTTLLFAYWGLFTWMPAYLSAPLDKGGAGLSIVKSLGWIIPTQIGALFGYTSFGYFSDRFGRKPAFIFFVLVSALVVPAYGLGARDETLLFLLGPLVGFFGHGYFSLFGAWLSELFDSSHRATAQGLCYNAGRAASGLAPVAIGSLADQHGIGVALSLTAAFYIAGALIILAMPETRAKELT